MIDPADLHHFYRDFPDREDDVQTDEERTNKYASLDRITQEPEYCEVCTEQIHTQVFKGTGVCGDRCHKVRAGKPLVTERPKGAA